MAGRCAGLAEHGALDSGEVGECGEAKKEKRRCRDGRGDEGEKGRARGESGLETHAWGFDHWGRRRVGRHHGVTRPPESGLIF